jgi:hypothetical protein
MALDDITALFARRPLDFLRTKVISHSSDLDPELKGERTLDLRGPKDRHLRFFSRPSFVVTAIVEDEGARKEEKAQFMPEPLQGRFKSVVAAVPIAWIRLKEHIVHPGAYSLDLEFASGDVDARIRRADRLPIYYLPWQLDKFVRMSIPPYREENVADFGIGRDHSSKYSIFLIDPYNPHLFFTAALTGCSVFVYGDPRHPTVTHVGTKTGTPYGDDSALFWRELLALERFQRLHQEGFAHEVSEHHYLGETPSFRVFSQWLTTQPKVFHVKSVTTFGSVFGIRYGSLWSFYLQEFAEIERYKVMQQKVVPRKQTPVKRGDEVVIEKVQDVRENASTTIPLRVQPFFPGGGGKVTPIWTFEKAYS